MTTRRLQVGESPDVFLAELRRLVYLAGGAPESLVRCAFVAGLPERVQDTLRSGVRMEDLSLGKLLTRARAILTKDYTDYLRDTRLASDQSSTYLSRTHGDSAIRCYACGGSNNFARECPTRRRDSAAIRRSENLNRQAHRRNRGRNLAGPIAPLHQGNEEREEVSAPAFSQLQLRRYRQWKWK
uniref:CCHC-type domain-containing protein n=1 Tax=Trichuris muris TaxID=70415 RepID=A0A5S6QGX7_TRIMR